MVPSPHLHAVHGTPIVDTRNPSPSGVLQISTPQSARSRGLLRVIADNRARSLSSQGSSRSQWLIDLNTPPNERHRGRHLQVPHTVNHSRSRSGSPWLIQFPGQERRFAAALTTRLDQVAASLIDQSARPPTPTALNDVNLIRTLLLQSDNAHSAYVGDALENFEARLISDDARDHETFVEDARAFLGEIGALRDEMEAGHADTAIRDLNLMLRLFRQEEQMARIETGFAHLGQLQALRTPLMNSHNTAVSEIGHDLHTLHAHLENEDDADFHALATELRARLDAQGDQLPPGVLDLASSDLNLMSDVYYSKQMRNPQSWDDLRDLRFPLMCSENAVSRSIATNLVHLNKSYWDTPRTVQGYVAFNAQADALERDIRDLSRHITDDHCERALLDVRLQRDAYVAELEQQEAQAEAQPFVDWDQTLRAPQAEASYYDDEVTTQEGRTQEEDRWWER